MIKNRAKFKKGAASFYIVAFSTLILMIVAISFATVIISEVERTSNDDLSQSAYDSALAGIEDAKMAYYNYQNCKNNPTAANCSNIIEIMEKEYGEGDIDKQCSMVWRMLGRDDVTGGNVVESTTQDNHMVQKTTCVTMTDETDGYVGNTSAGMDVTKIKFDDVNGAKFDYSNIKKIKISWFSDADRSQLSSKPNFQDIITGHPIFRTTAIPVASPPTIMLAVLQTSDTFTFEDFNKVEGTQTNRGMVYLVPNDKESGNVSTITKTQFARSNSKQVENTPYTVYCNGESYLCSVEIELPEAVGGGRNSETFWTIVGAPYGQKVSYRLDFFCDANATCPHKIESSNTEEGSESTSSSAVTLKGVQVEVDSTGLANDLYRRVKAVLKSKDDLALTVMGPLELIGDSNETDSGLLKNWTVTCEYDFDPQCSR